MSDPQSAPGRDATPARRPAAASAATPPPAAANTATPPPAAANTATPPPTTRRAALAALAVALPPGLYTLAVAQFTPPDPMLRAWLGGAIVPGRLAAEPWRLATAPLLHLEWGHLLPAVLIMAALVAALTRAPGARAAVTIAAASGVVGGLASAWTVTGWALGASGAMFGLIGAWAATRPAARAALALAAAAAWAAFGPGDAAAHLGGLATGALLGPLTGRWPAIGRVGVLVAAVIWTAALALAARHGAAAGTAGETRVARVGAAAIAVPLDYSAGVPVAPCAEAVTDGLLSICAIDATDAAAAEAALRAAGHVPARGAGGGGDFFLTARPPGVGVVIVRRAPGGPTVFVHALSAPALAHRAAVVDAIVKLSPPASSPPRR